MDCLILPLRGGSERTVFELLLASCFGPEMTEFLLSVAFLSVSGTFADVTELRCKKEA